MACILYCVTPAVSEAISGLIGVSDQVVTSHEAEGLRVYWSEVANPETLVEPPSRGPAEQKFRQVLREIVLRAGAISLPFPAAVADEAAIDALIAEQHTYYETILQRLANSIQYELTATWAVEEASDLATPVSGREYLKRRQESESRVAAIDAKLKTVTSGIVRHWRSHQDRRRHVWHALMLRDDRDRFIAALRSAGPSEGVRLRLSGPWPPDEFAATGDSE